jgi:hypothetical protein
MEQYSKRDFLDLFPEREPSKRLPYHDIRHDGVYLRMPDEFEIRVGLTEIPVEHPKGEPGKPALPFPFTLRQFLDFERTAGLVAEMSDDEVRALSERNSQSYELARAARDVESLALGAMSAEQRKAEASKLDHRPDFDEGREEECGMEQGFAGERERRGEPVDHEALRRRAIDEAIQRMGEHALVVWSLPDNRRYLPVSDALNITAAAIHPAAIGSDSLADAMRLQVTRDEQLRLLERAVRFGAVTILNSTTLTPMPPLSGGALERASIARDELQRFARVHLRIALPVPERFEQRQQRRAAGRYTLEEAANEIALKAGERADVMLGKLMKAAQAGELPVYELGRNARYTYGEGGALRVREDYEEAYASDLNKWLDEGEPRIKFRLPEEPREVFSPREGPPAEEDGNSRNEVPEMPKEAPSPVPGPTAEEAAKSRSDDAASSESATQGRESASHRLGRRVRDVLTPAIDEARKRATDPSDQAAVWNAFVMLAVCAPPFAPLIGVAEGEVKYQTADGPKCISRDAFNKRLGRAANRR